MKSFLKVLGLNLSVGLGYIMLVTFVFNGELAGAYNYLLYTLTSLLIPAVVSSALVQGLLLKKII